jgi:hypothetical protein
MVATQPQPATLVVVAHYNARPADALVALLDQIHEQPSGWRFDVCVVVNQAQPVPLKLPERHRRTRLLYRENTGFNIGAWNHGWRQAPGYDRYLFLQDECRIVGNPWLSPFMRRLNRQGVGLVGESWFAPRPITWDEQAAEYAHDHPHRDNFFRMAHSWLLRRGIDPGGHVDHLQSLVLATRRDVLERMNGFRIGPDKEQAIAAEIAISRAVVALGLRCTQVGFFPFSCIEHPQWRGHISRMLAPTAPCWNAPSASSSAGCIGGMGGADKALLRSRALGSG